MTNRTTTSGKGSTELETTFGPESPARILPLVSGSGNRQLLSKWISEQPEFEVVPTQPEADTLTTAEFDLCILDRATIQAYGEDLRSRKDASAPVLLPYLLLYPEDDPKVIEVDKGELADTVLRETVDEIVSLPLKKAELAWRVKSLLRLRSQSLQLKKDKQQLTRFKQAVDSAGHAVYITDSEGQIGYVNPAFERITGYDAGEVIGENPRILNSGRMTDDYFEDLWDTVTSGELWKEEVINERKNGEVYHAEQTIAPIIGPENTIESYVAIQQDITARKQERKKLEQYKQGVESAVDLLAAVDTDLEFLYANEKYCQYNDLDPNAIQEKALPDVLGEESFAEVEDAVNAAFAGEEKKLEITREPPGMGERTLQTFLFPIKDNDGEVRGVGASMRDITEQKEHERHLETLISNLPGIIYRCENEQGWPMEMVRGRALELTGYTAEKIETGAVSWGEDIIHPEDRKEVWNEIREAVEANEPFELTYRIITQSAEVKWVWEKGRQVTPIDSESAKLEGFISDITEQKQLEKELLESKERYESLFNSNQDAILVADTDRRITNCNPAFTELFGYELSEIKGKPTKYVYESEDEFEEMGNAIEGHLDDPEFNYTATYEKKSGQTFPGETNVFSLENANDEVVGYIGVVRDISDRQDRLTQLQVVDRVLQHNFHNDINIVQGFAEKIETEGSPPLSTYAETIRETGEGLIETVGKEREITEFLSDPPAVETVDLAQVTEQVVDEISAKYPEVNTSTNDANECLAEATVVIDRAIEELVTNCIIHSDSENPRVTVEVDSSEEYSTISVIDENPRIPEMERKILTGEEDLTPLYHGSGMGLWLVTRIVNHSDGVLEFDENEPRGNIVKIRLPTP
jgi:PAS domain S-box-containing protein